MIMISHFGGFLEFTLPFGSGACHSAFSSLAAMHEGRVGGITISTHLVLLMMYNIMNEPMTVMSQYTTEAGTF
jgi:hypothetical protein